MRSRCFGYVLLGCLLPLAGCGEDNPRGRLEISGTITLDGTPLDQGRISFSPQDEGIQSGALIEDGHYEIPASSGLLPGKYDVRIVSTESGSSVDSNEPPGPTAADTPESKDRIPAKYNTQTEEVVEVTESGPNVFDYKITSE